MCRVLKRSDLLLEGDMWTDVGPKQLLQKSAIFADTEHVLLSALCPPPQNIFLNCGSIAAIHATA